MLSARRCVAFGFGEEQKFRHFRPNFFGWEHRPRSIGFLSGDPQPYNARCGRAPSLEIVGVSAASTWRFAAGARDTGACTRGAAAIRTTLDHLSWLELTDLLLSTFASARSTPEHDAQVRQHRVPRRGTSRARPVRRTATAPAAPTVVASRRKQPTARADIVAPRQYILSGSIE